MLLVLEHEEQEELLVFGLKVWKENVCEQLDEEHGVEK